MARCNCGGSGGCSCRLVAGDGILLSGSGAPLDPFIITAENTSFANSFQALDTDSVALDLTGSGTDVDPFVLRATSAIAMEQLSNWDDPSGPAIGEVPVWNGVAWEAASPPTQAPGEVNVSDGILGDGTFSDPIRVAVSDDVTTSLSGLAIYVDSAGELRAVAPSSISLDWDDIDNKPTTFASTWALVGGKPTTFPPNIGTTSTTAWAGNRMPTWSEVSGKPYIVPVAPGAPGRAVTDVTGTNLMGLRWNGSRIVARVDSSEWALATADDVSFTNTNVSFLAGSKADAVDNVNQAITAKGTYQAHGNSVHGGGPYYAVWVSGPDTGYQFGRNTSSRRFKQDIVEHSVDKAAVLALQPVTYDRIGGQVQREYGLIAEDVYDAGLPEIVTWFKEEDSDESVIDGLRYDLLAVALLEVVKDQEARIAALEGAL